MQYECVRYINPITIYIRSCDNPYTVYAGYSKLPPWQLVALCSSFKDDEPEVVTSAVNLIG